MNQTNFKRNAAYVGLSLIIGAALWVASVNQSLSTPDINPIVCHHPAAPNPGTARIVLPTQEPRF